MINYIVEFDNGRDFNQLEFSSEHKIGSKQNKEDARNALTRKFGYHANNYDIITIFRF